MKMQVFLLMGMTAAGCAVSPRPLIWETGTVTRAHDVIGPVSVYEEVEESPGEMMQGIAQYLGKDGTISEHMPAEMKVVLEARKVRYKEQIFEKLAEKAQDSQADAVINTKYTYLPSGMSLSNKAIITAEGTMIQYR
jgi:hypothetical protein